MSEKKISRKELLQYGALAGIGLAGIQSELLAAPCGNPSAADMETRKQLQYVDKSVKAGQSCSNCLHYTGNANCGTCAVVKGPIAGPGWCTVWAKKA